MKKLVGATIVAGTVLVASAYAFGGAMGDCQNSKAGYFKSGFMGKGYHGDSFQGKRHGEHGMIMPYLSQLELSSVQEQEVTKIVEDMREKNYKSISSYFTNETFNKAEYEKASKQRFDSRFTNQASMIEKIYNVLNVNQKAKLKTLLNEADKNRNEFFKKMAENMD